MSDFAEFLRTMARENAEAMVERQFAEEPVSLSIFVQDKNYLGNPPLSPVQYDAVRHIERVYYNGWFRQPDGTMLYKPERDTYRLLAETFEVGKTKDALHVGSHSSWRDEPYWSEHLRMTNFATLQWGKGAGKDHVCRVVSMRVAYLLMCLESPQEYFGMPEQDTIHLLNVASTAPQAQQAFFMPITRAVKKGWFANRCTPRQNVISFAKNIEAVSGHSDAESQEGLNLLLGIADEIDAFKSKKEMSTRRGATGREPSKSAEGILNMMRSSSATRFPETFKQVRISYPRYLGSTIQILTKEAKDSIKEQGKDSRHYVSGPLATWLVNPRVSGKEAFAGDYADDPVMARSKYECKPARAVNPYFRNQIAIDACFEPRAKMPLTISYQVDGTNWIPKYHFAEDFAPIRGAVYCMHGDLAVKGDRAGIAMAHCAKYSEHSVSVTDDDGAIYQVGETRPNIKVDFCVSFTSDSAVNPPREIQIRWARQLCLELIKRGFNIRLFTFDTFQCMSGDTEIPLLDGTTRKLRELAGAEPFWVYSVSNGRIVPGLCSKAWRTGYREDMVEVELDNGDLLRTTSDHRFMLRDGTYRRADRLAAGDSLMPLYRRMRPVSPTSEEYEQIWHPEPDGSGKRWRFTHSMVSHHQYGPLPKGWVTHHKNCNPLDNRPGNLQQMTSADHTAWHQENAAGLGTFARLWADPEWANAHRQRLGERRRAEQTGVTGEQARRYRKDITIEVIATTHRACIEEGVTPTKEEMRRRLGITQPLLYDRVRAAGYRSWKHFRDVHEGVSEWNLYQREWRRNRKRNHFVVAVRPAPPEDVYDLQVEEHHNFATAAGVFVHNSVDSMQILQAKGIDSKKVSCDTSDEVYRNLRDLMYDGRVKIPRPIATADQPSFLLRDELFSLTRMSNGRIDHPADGSKDEADALACAVKGAVELGGAEDEKGERAHFAPPEFHVGRTLTLPVGASFSRVFERPNLDDLSPLL